MARSQITNPQSEIGNQELKILVVDDNQQNLYMLQVLLQGHGYEVESATNGAEALEIARRDPPDLVITDILMPVMDGFSLCRQWKGDERLKEIPFVFYTATYTDPKDEEFALSLGADRFIIKPQEPDAFVEILREVLENHEAGSLVAPREPMAEEAVYYRGYNEALIRKLEDKMVQLEQEIAERRRAQKELQESEERFRGLFEGIPACCWTFDREGVILDWNRACEELYGWSAERAVGKTIYSLMVKGENVSSTYERVAAVFQGQSFYGLERTDWRADGTTCSVLVSEYPLEDASGQVVLGICAELDISERVRAAAEREQLLAQIQGQARQVQQIVDTVPEGVLLLNTDGQVVLANPTAVGNLTVLAGARVGDILTHLGDCSVEELLTSPPKGLWHEVTVDEPALQHFEVIAKPVETGLATGGWVLVIRDVTQEREVQQQLRRQEQLAVVGQLAGGIAHDFNNFLTIIMLYAQMALGGSRQDLPPNVTRALETILGESRRATELVQQILDFSRRSPIKLHSVDLDPFIKEAIRVLERTIPENIRLRIEIEPERHIALDEAEAMSLAVNADPTRIQQVLMNLVVNARDAMPEGGELSIGLSGVEVRPDEAPPVAGMDAGAWVCLAISDTGIGISPDAQPHLFEPFFTTKQPGEGTGLGLAQVYGIVTQHDGHIGVVTEVGKGTTFRIYLPASRTEENVVAEEVLSTPEGKGEVILLVEDNEKLREGGQSLLESLGYQVLTAANGQEALRVYKAEGGGGSERIRPESGPRGRRIDLVITDLVMPEIGGKQLIRELREKTPDIKVLVATGYVMQEDLEKLEEEGFLGVIHKPFDVDTLARVVRQALDED